MDAKLATSWLFGHTATYSLPETNAKPTNLNDTISEMLDLAKGLFFKENFPKKKYYLSPSTARLI